MKKIIFLSLLFPMLAIGQNDSLKARQILEKSIKAMSIPYKSIEYTIIEKSCYMEVGQQEENHYKYVYDTDTSISQAWCGRKIENSKNFEFETFRNKHTDTTYFYMHDLDILKLYEFADFDLRYYENGYFKQMIDRVKSTLEQKIDTSFVSQIAFSYQGMAYDNNKPYHLIKEWGKYASWVGLGACRTGDGKMDMYYCRDFYLYYFIDTSSYMLSKIVSFSISENQDTVLYSSSKLVDWQCNTFDNIEFHPGNPRKIISYLPNPQDTCDGVQIIKDIAGKGPNITGIDSAGKAFSLYKQKAQCYVIDFSFAACGACAELFPFWLEMQQKYNHPNIQYLIVDPIDDMEKIKRLIKRESLTIPVIQDKNAAKKYAISSYPSFYILDKNFNILYSGTYPTSCQKMEIEKILSKYHTQTK